MVRRVAKSGRHAAPGSLRSLGAGSGSSLLDDEAIELDDRIRARMDAEAAAAEAESVATDAAARAAEAIAVAARAAEEADMAADIASRAAADAAAAAAEERSTAMARAAMARDVALMRAATQGSNQRGLAVVREQRGARVTDLGNGAVLGAMEAPTEQIVLADRASRSGGSVALARLSGRPARAGRTGVSDRADAGARADDPGYAADPAHDDPAHDDPARGDRAHDDRADSDRAHDNGSYDPRSHDDRVYDPRSHDPRSHDPRSHDHGYDDAIRPGDPAALGRARAGDLAPIATGPTRVRAYPPPARRPHPDVEMSLDDGGRAIPDDEPAPRAMRSHSRRAPRAHGWLTSRPVLIAAAAAGVIALLLAVIVVAGSSAPDAPATETTTETVPAPDAGAGDAGAGSSADQENGAGGPVDTAATAEQAGAPVLGDRSAAAYLEALDAADVPTSPSGRTEIEAAVAICTQLKQGAEEADLVRAVPALLSSIPDEQAETVVTIAKTYYC